eukprot:2146963-Rhodomonas_salina.2
MKVWMWTEGGRWCVVTATLLSLRCVAAALDPATLTHHYEFEAANFVGDTSGNGNTLTAVNNPTSETACAIGGCARLDQTGVSNSGGAVQHFVLPSIDFSAYVTTGVSISLWYKTTGPYGSYPRLFELGNGYSTTGGFFSPAQGTDNFMCTVHSTGGMYLSGRVGTSQNPLQSLTATPVPSSETVDLWRHVMWVIKASGEWELYSDGDLLGTMTNSLFPQIATPLAENYIGQTSWPRDPIFDGWIDDFRIYAATLTAQDAIDLYRAVVPVPPLTHHY